jgi:hypothetical protein
MLIDVFRLEIKLPPRKGGVTMANGNNSIRYDPDKLRKMIAEGRTAKEITTEFRISPYALREHLVMLQEIDKKVYVIEGLFDHSDKEKPKYRKEGIVFHKEVLEKIGFKPGDAFEMRAIGNRIILEKIMGD